MVHRESTIRDRSKEAGRKELTQKRAYRKLGGLGSNDGKWSRKFIHRTRLNIAEIFDDAVWSDATGISHQMPNCSGSHDLI
jgi:hypothetical protein